jgi:hypothetical protein
MRPVLFRAVRGVVGAVFGSLATGVLVMIFALDHWLVLLPVLIGAVIGVVGGERGLMRFVRLIGKVF